MFLSALLLVPALAVLLFFLVALFFALQILFIRPFPTDYIRNQEAEAGADIEGFESLPFEPFRRKNRRGEEIAGAFVAGSGIEQGDKGVSPSSGEKTILFCHGVQACRYSMAKYTPYFRLRGWNLLYFDHRGHGESGGGRPTYGLREKEDLKLMVDAALERFPQTAFLGILGESMGASTVMDFSSIDDRADFFVADCGYSDFSDLMDYLLKIRHIPRFLRRPLLAVVNPLLKWWGPFGMEDISPRRAIVKSPVPLCLFHGEEDTYVPSAMSEEILRERRKTPCAPTELCLIPGAIHTRSILTDPETYHRRLDTFLTQAEALVKSRKSRTSEKGLLRK